MTWDRDRELEKWVGKAQAGDKQAQERLFALTKEKLQRFCQHLCGDPARAQDLCQETFLRTFPRLLELREPGAYFSWLAKTAKYLFLDQNKGPRGRISLRISELTLIHDGWRGVDSLDLGRALNKLSPDHRAVLLIVDGEGLSYKEAANRLGVSTSAIRSRLNRARCEFVSIYQAA